MDLEQEIERIARQHELGSYCGSQFILDRRCLAALREMAAFTRKQTLEEIRTRADAEIARWIVDGGLPLRNLRQVVELAEKGEE